jgi:DNA primase
LETIDKIGPTDAKITIREIEDVRGSKRDYIMERAKQLLSKIQSESMDTKEIGNELRESARTAKIVSYGSEGLAAGPEVETSNEIIVVEGRADVVNLLKYGFNNVIGMQGTRFPKTITDLGETKEITLFTDGDRGGNLIIQNVCNNAKIAYITQAPDGKEVEELTGKEIHQSLRKKVPANVFLKKFSESVSEEREPSVIKEKRDITDEDKKKIRKFSNDLKSRNVLILNENLEVVRDIPLSRLNTIRLEDVFVLISSTATPILVSNAERLHAKAIAAKTFVKLPDTLLEMISI